MRSAALLALGLAACLDPLVSDELPDTGVLPPGTVVPALADDPYALEELEEYDGLEDFVPRWTAFAGGDSIHTWDLGPTAAFAAPVYSLGRITDAGFERVDHNSIVDRLPGDAGYSPYWVMYWVIVTDAYRGEIIPSVAALDEAVQRGLIEPPMVQEFAIDCPIVAPDVALEMGNGDPPRTPVRSFYVGGRTVPYFDFGRMPVVDHVRVPDIARYVLRREGGEPLNEPWRGVDITGDGDAADSNDVYALSIADPAPSPLCRTVNVAVPAATASIDTSQDETMAALRDALQLFAPGPLPTVVAYQVTDELRHCVLQREERGW